MSFLISSSSSSYGVVSIYLHTQQLYPPKLQSSEDLLIAQPIIYSMITAETDVD